jgi:CheY-like chemotaxis protein
MLKMQGYTIELVDNGQKAADAVQARARACQANPEVGCFDLVLMDVQVRIIFFPSLLLVVNTDDGPFFIHTQIDANNERYGSITINT